MEETDNEANQANKELLELIKEAKNTDMTVGEFKEKLNDMEKRFGEENFDVKDQDPDYDAIFDTPEMAFASHIYNLSKSKDKNVVREENFYPEVYFNYWNKNTYEEVLNLAEDKDFFNQFDPYYDLPDLKQKMHDELSKHDKGYRVCSYNKRDWSRQSLESHGDSKGYVFPNEDEFMDWHLNKMENNFIEACSQYNSAYSFKYFDRNEHGSIELKISLGLRDFEPLSDEKEYEYLENFKEKGWSLFKEDEEKLHEYRVSEFKGLKGILLSDDEGLEEQEKRLAFLVKREIDYFEEKGDRKAVFSYLKDMELLGLPTMVGKKEYEQMKNEFEPKQTKAKNKDTDCSFG